MKKICILYTGGTIGMVPTSHGYAPKSGYFRNALSRIDELKDPAMPGWELIEFDPLLDSSNIAVEQWNRMGRVIAENYKQFDGFVILHGTDTMAYTASALSFMLEGLNKPVILTGSQIPLCRLRSDARDNIITSLLIAAEGRVREVCLYFGGKLMRGNRSTKSSADGLLAFDSPNFPNLASVGIDIAYNKILTTSFRDSLTACSCETSVSGGAAGYSGTAIPDKTAEYRGTETLDRTAEYREAAIPDESVSEEFHLTEFRHAAIGVIKIFPGIQFRLFEPIMTEGLNGIVLETFGTGNIPAYGSELLPMIRRAFENGTIVCVCSQCPQGTVRLGAYETSSMLTDAGAVSGGNMTTEAAIAKLYYLFSLGLSRNEIKANMETPLRGEGDF